MCVSISHRAVRSRPSPTLKRLESRLPRQQFKRIHRSFIANLCRMDSIGHMRIYYGETSIPISDSYKDAVYQFINSHLA